jgi:hypothetical protein
MAKKKAAKMARPKATSSHAKRSRGSVAPSKAAVLSEPDVFPSPITDGKPLSVYLVAFGVNRDELVDVDVDETDDFSVIIPKPSQNPLFPGVSEVYTDDPCVVTRTSRAPKSKPIKLFATAKLTITILPAGAPQPVKLPPVKVTLIPAS